MTKIKVHIILENKENGEILDETYDGFCTKEKLVYKEPSKRVTIYRENNTIKMIRREQEQTTFLTFQKGMTEGKYEMKSFEPISFTIKTFLLEEKENSIHICYQTELLKEAMGNFDFKLQYEVIK